MFKVTVLKRAKLNFSPNYKIFYAVCGEQQINYCVITYQ